jgi:heme/copper-type cytochrome/quinol oxidase subunit 2
MHNSKKLFWVGVIFQTIPILLIITMLYLTESSFNDVANVQSFNKAAVLSEKMDIILKIFYIGSLFGFVSFLYLFVMVKIRRIEIARKLRKLFLILGIFSLWGGVIPLILLLITKKMFINRNADGN